MKWALIAGLLLAAAGAGIILIPGLNRKSAPSPHQAARTRAPVAPDRPQASMPSVKFTDITREAGINFVHNSGATGAKLLPETMGGGIAFFDYDNAGKLDLFVANHIRWSKEIDAEVGYSLPGIGRAYGPPMNFEGAFPHLYHNEGDGTFRERGALTGVAFDSYGNTRGAMGIDTARFRNNGALGIAIGNFANEMTALYVSQTSPTHFADEAVPEGIGLISRALLKFGIFFFDYDLDGWLDLLSVNGHLEEEINKVQQTQHYAQPAQLFWNAGGSSPVAPCRGPTARSLPMETAVEIVGATRATAGVPGSSFVQ